MRIEEGKTYVDENGKKAGPLIGVPFKYIAGRSRADDPEWDNDGTVCIEGEEGYGNLVAEWTEGPIVTETVQRIEWGVYGLLQVSEGMRPKTVHVYAYDSASAPELRELARVALEIAEYLEHVD